MKERPIIFNADMVNAILEGRKTQTRRVMKPQPSTNDGWFSWHGNKPNSKNGAFSALNAEPETINIFLGDCSPYGQSGERLWVRETHYINGIPCPEEPTPPVIYRADPLPCWEGEEQEIRWKPSIHMNRWASRITLEIVNVRVERLKSISEADAMAEGIELPENGTYRDYSVKPEDNEGYDYCKSAVDSYRTLWEKINGPGSWDANPWVWVVEFKRVEASQ